MSPVSGEQMWQVNNTCSMGSQSISTVGRSSGDGVNLSTIDTSRMVKITAPIGLG